MPILSSGVDGVVSPELVSTTTTYDFFAVPVSCDQCTLYGFVKDNCEDIVSGTVRVWVKKPFSAQGIQNAIEETVEIRESDDNSPGYFEIPLVIPDEGTLYNYEIKFVDSDGKNWKRKGTLQIPNAATALFNTTIVK